MEKGSGKAGEGAKAVFGPQVDGGVVGADDKVELDGAVTCHTSVVDGVGAHGAGDALASGVSGCEVAAVGDMGSAALLVGLDVVGADGLAVLLGDEDGVLGREPVGEGGGTVHIGGKGEDLRGAEDGLEHAPEEVVVGFAVLAAGSADGEHGLSVCGQNLVRGISGALGRLSNRENAHEPLSANYARRNFC